MKPTAKYEIGGVMRCCIATLYDADVTETKGERVPCKCCGHGFEFDGEVWRKWWGEAGRYDKTGCEG
jgi:hypothetical protein